MTPIFQPLADMLHANRCHALLIYAINVYMSLCQYVCLSISLSKGLYVSLYISEVVRLYLSICICVSLDIYVSVCLSLHLYFCMKVNMTPCQCDCLPVWSEATDAPPCVQLGIQNHL